MLPDDELCIGLEVVAQQIAWGVPKQLAAALQTVSFAAEYRPDLLTTHPMELILTGLSQLLEQTRISSDDTVATASEKGDIRRWAVILATKIDAGKISKDGQEILKIGVLLAKIRMSSPKSGMASDNESKCPCLDVKISYLNSKMAGLF